MSGIGSSLTWRHVRRRSADQSWTNQASARGGPHAEAPEEALSATPARPMLYQLHVLRALAVLLVVLDHSCLAIADHMPVPPLCIQLAWLAGFLGVAIFFAISGYIMVATTRSQPRTQRAVVRFLARRLMRIVPMYYLATGLSILFALSHLSSGSSALNPLVVICSLLFIPIADAHHVVQPVLTQGWTLNNEIFFYLLFGVLLLLPSRARAATLAGLLVIAAAIGALCNRSGYDLGEVAGFLTAPITLNFVPGLLLAAYSRSKVGRGSPWQPTLVVTTLAIGLFAGVFYVWETQPGHVVVFGWWMHVAVLAVAASSCWLCTRSNTPFPTTGVSGAAARLAMLLGDASYTTYLFHLFVISAVVRVCLFAGIGPAFTAVCCVVLAIAFSALLHLRVERHLNAWMRRLSPRLRGGRYRGVRYAS